jgi:hypothetical protein
VDASGVASLLTSSVVDAPEEEKACDAVGADGGMGEFYGGCDMKQKYFVDLFVYVVDFALHLVLPLMLFFRLSTLHIHT